MTEAAGHLDLEALLADALRPIEPPESLTGRVETTLSAITEQAAAALGEWADELSESELQARRATWQPHATMYGAGSLWKYAQQVGPAYLGAVTHPGAKAEVRSYAEL